MKTARNPTPKETLGTSAEKSPIPFEPVPGVPAIPASIAGRLAIVVFAITILLVLDLPARWFDHGVRLETAVILAVELVMGFSLQRDQVRKKVFGWLRITILKEGWQKLIASIVFFVFVLILIGVVMPKLGEWFFTKGAAKVYDPNGDKTLGIPYLESALQLQPGPILSTILLLLETKTTYGYATAAHYALGVAQEKQNATIAENEYIASKQLDTCYLWSDWGLAQILITKGNIKGAHAILGDALKILTNEEQPQCQAELKGNSQTILQFGLNLTNARAYILDKEPNTAKAYLNKAQLTLQTLGIDEKLNYYYWHIMMSQSENDCSAIKQDWASIQQALSQSPQAPTDLIRDRINGDAKKVYDAC